MSQVKRATNKDGIEMEYPMSQDRLNLVRLAVPEEKFLALFPKTPTTTLARYFGITPHDVEGLINYHGLKRETSPPRPNVKVDELAERIMELLGPRIDARVAAALEQYTQPRNGAVEPVTRVL